MQWIWRINKAITTILDEGNVSEKMRTVLGTDQRIFKMNFPFSLLSSRPWLLWRYGNVCFNTKRIGQSKLHFKDTPTSGSFAAKVSPGRVSIRYWSSPFIHDTCAESWEHKKAETSDYNQQCFTSFWLILCFTLGRYIPETLTFSLCERQLLA